MIPTIGNVIANIAKSKFKLPFNCKMLIFFRRNSGIAVKPDAIGYNNT